MLYRHRLTRLACLAMAAIAATATAAPSQMPLLNQPNLGVAPNLVYTLDDSGSMNWRFMPDDASFVRGTSTAAEQNARWQQSFHPSDKADSFTRGYQGGAAHTFTTRDGDWWSARMRSASHNRIYYDPQVRYRPWLKADGSRMAEADPAAALRDPLKPGTLADGGAVNLKGEFTVPGNAIWCRSNDSVQANAGPSDAQGATCNAIAGETIAPATYFNWTGGNTSLAASYRRVRIMDMGFSVSMVAGASRTDCAPAGTARACTQAQEYQNFANWFTYYRTRLYTAIAATSEAFVAQGDSFRLGYARIGKERATIDGVATETMERGVRPFAGADRTEFFTWLQSVRAESATPLRKAMDDVGQYYSRADGRSPWGNPPASVPAADHAACRRSFHILMTDGFWNGAGASTAAAAGNVDGTSASLISSPPGASPARSYSYQPAAPYTDGHAGTLADIAMYYANRDLRPDLPNLVPVNEKRAGDPFWQNVTNYTVGLGVGGTLDPTKDLPALTSGTKKWPLPEANAPTAVDDLWHAAVNSYGKFLSAMNPTEFSQALGSVLEDIGDASRSSAGQATSGRKLETTTRKYTPVYQSDGWWGDLQAFTLGAQEADGKLLWSAASRLPGHKDRNIQTLAATTTTIALPTPFTHAALKEAGLLPLLGADTSAGLVNYLRGDRSLEGKSYRARTGLLGDIINSQPLVVHDGLDLQYSLLPKGTPGRDSYQQFLQAKAARGGLVFFGANDGMLHAVTEKDGIERFAYVPAAVLGAMAQLASPNYQHRFLVDGLAVEGDAWWDGRWRNLVLGTTGAGPAAVFAIDAGVLKPLWEFGAERDAALGAVLAAPESGITRGGQWVALFGNGFGGAGGKARLYVVNLQTGALIRSIDAEGGAGNGLGGVRVARDDTGRIVAAYAGDLQGNLWRFDLQSAEPSRWKVGLGGVPLYSARDAAGAKQAITATPEYIAHPRGGVMVLAGTGRLFEDADVTSTQPQALLGLWDKAPIDEASAGSPVLRDTALATHGLRFAEQSTLSGSKTFVIVDAKPMDWTIHRGWKVPVPGPLRDVYGPIFERGFMRAKIVAPGLLSAAGCTTKEPYAFDVQVNPLTGAMSTQPLFDTNGDGVVDGLDTVVAGVPSSADRMVRALLNKRGAGKLLDAGRAVDYGMPRMLRSWRQIVNFPQ